MAKATLPEQPEPAKRQSAKKFTNGRKSAFRRNPLLPTSTLFTSQPLEPSLDTSAAGGASSLTTQSVQEGNLTPDTSRSSRWGFGGLVESARSIKSRLGFSPLTSESESPELTPQTPITSTAQILVEVTAPKQPKTKGSSPISARDVRAKSADGNEGEAGQAKIEEPTAKPTILWPSRSLYRMNNNKRKRWGEPVATPSPKDGSYGRGETNICGSSEDGETEGQPGKIRRTGEAERFTSQVAGHQIEHQGGNVFAEWEAARKAGNPGMQPLAKIPIPITNLSGTFKVPSPSDSGSDEEEGNITGLGDITTSRNNSGDVMLASPRYRPSNLPDPQQILRPSQQEALRKARAKVLQHKPRNPSRLSQSSRAYQSPPPADKHDSGPPAALEDPGVGRANYNAFREWSRTASPAVASAVENMEVDSNFAGQAFMSGLDNFTKVR